MVGIGGIKCVKIEAMKLKVIIIGVGLVILALVVYYHYIIYPIQLFQSGKSPSPSPSPTISKPPRSDEGRFCIQVITPAKNPSTGDCREFPTPCDVPEGWEKVSGCN